MTLTDADTHVLRAVSMAGRSEEEVAEYASAHTVTGTQTQMLPNPIYFIINHNS